MRENAPAKILKNLGGRGKFKLISFACVLLRAARKRNRSKVLVVADHRHRGVGAGGRGGRGLGARTAGLSIGT